MLRTFILSALTLGIAFPGHSADAPRTIRLLTIGNSFADNATEYLPAIAKADPGVILVLGKANLGGCTLERHATLAAASAADPGKGPYSGKMSLQQMLKKERWDFVTLQQQSQLSTDYTTFQPWLDQLRDLVRAGAPQAEILLHETWAYRPDHPLLPAMKMNQTQMYENIRESYARAAAHLDGARLLPVGTAFQRARDVPGYAEAYPLPRSAIESVKFPALPAQPHSLVVGYYWQKDGQKLAQDAKHANLRGRYLGAAVWWEVLTGKDIRKNSFRPDTLDAGDWKFLQDCAHQAVAESAKTRP